MPLLRPSAGVLAALLAIVSAAAATGASGPWHDDGPAAVRLVSPWSDAPREGELGLGLEFALDPGWHVYWLNSGDAGYPPKLELSEPADLSGFRLLFPVPHRYDLPGGLVAFGYSERVVYPLTGRVGFGEKDQVRFAGLVDYVVCASECVPFRTRVELDQPVSATPRPDLEAQALLAAWRARVPVPAPSGAATARLVDRSDAGGTIELSFSGLPVPAADLFFAPHDRIEPGRSVHRRVGSRDLFAVPFAWKVRRDADSRTLSLDWTVALEEGGWTGRSEVSLAIAGLPAAPRVPWPWRVVLVAAALGLGWSLWPRTKRQGPA